MIYSTKETMKYIIVASSVIGAVLSLLLFNDVFHWISITLPSKGVMSATFGYRNYFGQYLCFAVPAAVISLFMLKSDKARLCMLICCITSMGGLILTRTRAAWMGVFIALLVFAFLNRHAILVELQTLMKNKKAIAILIASAFLIIYIINIPSHAALVLVRINPPILKMQQINMHNLVLSDFSIKSDMTAAGTAKHKYCPK